MTDAEKFEQLRKEAESKGMSLHVLLAWGNLLDDKEEDSNRLKTPRTLRLFEPETMPHSLPKSLDIIEGYLNSEEYEKDKMQNDVHDSLDRWAEERRKRMAETEKTVTLTWKQVAQLTSDARHLFDFAKVYDTVLVADQRIKQDKHSDLYESSKEVYDFLKKLNGDFETEDIHNMVDKLKVDEEVTQGVEEIKDEPNE
jgi:hypothetical protein